MIRALLRLIAAVVVAELIMIVLITFFQETLAHGVVLNKSSFIEILIGGLGTLFAGFLAGIISSLIAKEKDSISISILSCFVFLETAYLIITERIANPVWFDVLAAISLIASLWIGYYIYISYLQKKLR